jgi:CRISPR/Cas system CMR-associated protein Cmr1 (group 7 of RAMP superfamily)
METQTFSEEFLRMQKLAGIITESQFQDLMLILENENIDEGLKDTLRKWITAGLIGLTAIGGAGKVYQLDQQDKLDTQNKIEYYDNVLKTPAEQMAKDSVGYDSTELGSLGNKISSETGELSISSDSEADAKDLNNTYENYARKYMKAHPDQFGVSLDGKIVWLADPGR